MITGSDQLFLIHLSKTASKFTLFLKFICRENHATDWKEFANWYTESTSVKYTNHENRILKSKLQNLRKCSKEQVDQYDICLYVCEKHSDITKYDVINNLWKPDIDYKFPVYIDEKNLKDKRKFGFKWFALFPWLCFSKFFEGTFCLYCVLFSTTYGINTSKLEHLCQLPLSGSKNALRTLKNHSKKSYHHKLATSSMKGFPFTTVNKKKKVNNWLSALDRQTTEKNRLVIKSLTKIILTMAC